MSDLIVVERHSSSRSHWGSGSTKEFSITKSGRIRPGHHHQDSSLRRFLIEAFLPQGYPESVSSDYLEYQVWDTIQAFCSSLNGSFATRAVLKGAGVGDESATALAATVSWLLRDGTGMVSRIVFAWWKGQDLDFNNKQWRLFADVACDIATALNMSSALFGDTFYTPILCLSSATLALVSVAGGATRVAVQQHQALRGNMADVSAKDGSQESVVNLSALFASLLILPLVEGSLFLTWVMFLVFTAIHLYANFRAVSCLKYSYFNRVRAEVCWRSLFEGPSLRRMPSVAEANAAENVLPHPLFLIGWRPLPRIWIGRSVSAVPGNVDRGALDCLDRLFEKKLYVVYPSCREASYVFLREVEKGTGDVPAVVQLEALFVALSFHARSSQQMRWPKAVEVDWLLREMKEAMDDVDVKFGTFKAEAEAQGWRINESQLGSGEVRLVSVKNAMPTRIE
ncbi:unnamed protein product [Cyprideis torosa]|uniref:Protein root UVB sensitive/RUS domain-containing protein n=1 Tax=Cyprideis torosa TaxID=163714 RepID=A0A7R8ZQE8_9CRUS|nr:unnamed protein product [Cyprideis torosa]CAG0890497.1 unnamed protein product [Cyprideis torosa]